VRFRLLLALAWLLGAYVLFAFFEALGATDGRSVTSDFDRRLHSDFPLTLLIVTLTLRLAVARDRRARRRSGLPENKPWDPVDAKGVIVVREPLAHAFEAVLAVVRALSRTRVVSADVSSGHRYT
jgi:hypothetical protein